MVALERYDLDDVTRGGEAWREMNLSPEGDWVKYDQVALIVQEQHEATNFTYCAYCGFKSPVDKNGEEIAAHIRTCDKHPMRAMELEYDQRMTTLRNTISDLRSQLEAQSVTYQDNLTEIQLLKDQLQREELKHNSTIDAANSAQIYIEALEATIRKPCEIYPGLSLHTREDGIWLCFAGEGATGKQGMVHLGNHFGHDRVVGPAVNEWLQRMKRWEERP